MLKILFKLNLTIIFLKGFKYICIPIYIKLTHEDKKDNIYFKNKHLIVFDI